MVRNHKRSCLCASGMKDFTRVNIVAQGKGEKKKKKSSEGHFTIRELTVKEKNEVGKG